MKAILAGLGTLFFNFMVFAQDKKPSSPGDLMGSMVPMMLIMFVIIYLFMILPEQKKNKARQAMMSSLKKGDKVITTAGIHGTVGNVKDNSVMLKVADNTIMEFTKSAITTILNDDGTERKPDMGKPRDKNKEEKREERKN